MPAWRRRLTCGRILALALLASAPVGAQDGSPAHERPGEDAYPRLHLIGFADANYFTTSEEVAPSSGFFEGQFVLHFAAALSAHFGFFGETSLTARRDAATSSSAPGFSAEVERAILKYSRSDVLKISVGRYHTPINYWNVAFHHGQWLQTTVSRPEMIQFGGQFLPVHFVGVLAEGALRTGGAALEYDLGFGNGRSSVISRAGDATDVNNNRAWLAGLALKPDRPFGLQAGVAFYHDRVTLPLNRPLPLDHGERIVSAYLAFTRETPEVLAEYARVEHEDLQSGRTFASHAWYVQAAYRLPFVHRQWKPYCRYERIRVAAGDVVFAALTDRSGFVGGVRDDVSDLVALKAEYRRQRSAEQPYSNALYLQAALSF